MYNDSTKLVEVYSFVGLVAELSEVGWVNSLVAYVAQCQPIVGEADLSEKFCPSAIQYSHTICAVNCTVVAGPEVG
jgi:hypothetical protein